MVGWVGWLITSTLRNTVKALRERDELLEKAIESHIAESNTRLALLEKSYRELQHAYQDHSQQIQELWKR